MTLRKQLIFLWLGAVCLLNAQAAELHIYLVDVEGGAATLIVTPEREAVLIDSGWRREDGRDAKRIHEVATRLAGLKRIDYFITTHFHRDHYGGATRLSQMIPISNFLDRGPVVEPQQDPQFASLYTAYVRASRGERQKIWPGDEIPLKQGAVPLQLRCLASDGETIGGDGEPNPACSALQPGEDVLDENGRSVALLLRFGNFEFLACGDLTLNIESKLACPVDLVGKVDAYQVTHHGLKNSNHPVFVRSIQPTVALINNGATKGGDAQVFALLKSVPSLQDIFQIHLNLATGAEDNTARELIANLGPDEECAGHWIRLAVHPDGSRFTVTNGRNDVTRSYAVQ